MVFDNRLQVKPTWEVAAGILLKEEGFRDAIRIPLHGKRAALQMRHQEFRDIVIEQEKISFLPTVFWKEHLVEVGELKIVSINRNCRFFACEIERNNER